MSRNPHGKKNNNRQMCAYHKTCLEACSCEFEEYLSIRLDKEKKNDYQDAIYFPTKNHIV